MDAAGQVVRLRLLQLGTAFGEWKPDAWISVRLAWRAWLGNRAPSLPEPPPPPGWARSQPPPYRRRPGAPSAMPGERLPRKSG